MYLMTIIQDIATTAAEEITRETLGCKRDTINEADGVAEEYSALGLDADGFVTVCLQLMRDNFLVKVGHLILTLRPYTMSPHVGCLSFLHMQCHSSIQRNRRYAAEIPCF